VNNNYSQHTLESYARDLLIFELFLDHYNIKFESLNKLHISEYKGYLRTAQHSDDLDVLKMKLRNKKNDSTNTHKAKNDQEEEIMSEESSKNDDLDQETDLILGKALMTKVLQKSRSKASKRRGGDTDGLNSRSINRMLSSIRSFLGFLIEIDETVPIPPEAITMVKTEKRESHVAEFHELIKLIEAPDEYETKQKVKYRNRAILELLFSTGMRISELTNLDIEDLNYDPARKKIEDNKIYVYGKGKKQRYVYMTERAITFLERYLSSREDDFPALFIPYRGQRVNEIELDSIRISQRYVQSIIKRYRKLVGISIPTTPHSLRHGFATYLAEEGANPAAIQHLLGHESLQTTTRYVHSSDRFAEQTHQKFHPLKDKE
ncbi:tyrosine-type recombinase/integrase, partial [Candidatus Dojkabacteria bacterium]|nr:tyrosine-type recombinase/integrase [Candidatus Dojkabacteria bacterium]